MKRRKWRPRLWLVLVAVLGVVLCLPFAGLLLFKFYANQLVQQAEESLLSQASIMSALYAETYAETAQGHSKPVIPEDLAPLFPSLSLSESTILPPRPDARTITETPDPIYDAVGERLSRIADLSQIGTLAGYRFLDPSGNVIGGSAEVGLSLAHVDEVAMALQGQTASVARMRIRSKPEPFLYDFSRGTRVRIFVAMPATLDGELIGAVYISRTPNHIFRFLYGERLNLARAGLFVLLATALVGFLFWRFITRPIHSLIRHMSASDTRRWTWQPIDHLGTREIENLSDSFQSLTERLQTQQDALRSYTAHVTHELKSPMTAAKGALELLRDGDMPEDQRQRFLANVARDIDRMETLLAKMREYSLADQKLDGGETDLMDVLAEIRSSFPQAGVGIGRNDAKVPVGRDALLIILSHLVGNASQHGATRVLLDCTDDAGSVTLTVTDNGKGISEGNLDKVFTPFFTTRRDDGGTGMGLNIVKSVVEASNGKIDFQSSPQGVSFHIVFDRTGHSHL